MAEHTIVTQYAPFPAALWFGKRRKALRITIGTMSDEQARQLLTSLAGNQ
jgi:hypothetical protein